MTRFLLLLMVAGLLACSRAAPSEEEAEPLAQASEQAEPAGPGFEVKWSPNSGKGEVVQRLPGGDVVRICLQCRYPGYAGGLWLGSMNGSGFQWAPKEPKPGFEKLNIFCAQDESLYDETEQVEYHAGWSENFQKSHGVRMEYLGGEVVADGSGEQDLVLRSLNQGGCWRVSRYLLWPRGAWYVVISSRITNTCDKARVLSFWTGEDPWIGKYRTSDGDVGWSGEGILRTETIVDAKSFRHGGVYDLGNELLGQDSAAFSGAANFVAVDPGLTRPDRVYFANRFAHEDEEIDPKRPLDNKSLTAWNLGWVRRRVEPGGELRIRYALGRALVDGPGDLPRPPEIPPEHWDFDKTFRAAAKSRFKTDPAASGFELPIRFREEEIRLRLEPPLLHVDALYIFENRTDGPQITSMYYPFPMDDGESFPESIEVDGAPFRKRKRGLIWRLRLKPRQERAVQVRYTQRFPGPHARYILTSTGRWGEPLARALYEVRWPQALKDVKVSYGGERRGEDGWIIQRFEKEDFSPDRDLALDWLRQ